MKNILLLIASFVSTHVLAQQTIPQTILLRSNGINSTEILMYKEDNTTYHTIYSNHGGFGIYNSGTNAITFFINSSGNVGIGTALPKERLSVNGKIRAHEIKVETANWPDYVFAKDFQLPSLKETEKYINEKGHLPGIPSAEEVKVNGIDLGEMNAKLLQKIEELTLHLIEKEKKEKVQQLNLELQNDAIKKLTSRLESLERKSAQ